MRKEQEHGRGAAWAQARDLCGAAARICAYLDVEGLVHAVHAHDCLRYLWTRATRKISYQPIIRRSAWRSSPSRYDTFSSGHPSTAARAPEPTATAWAGGPQRASVGENGGTHLDRGLCGRLDEKAAAVGRHRAGHARRVTSSPALPCAYRRDGTRAHPRLSRTAWVPSSGGAPPECGSRRNAPRPLPTRSRLVGS